MHIATLVHWRALMALPLVLPLLAAAEGAWRTHKGLGYDWKAWWTSLGDAFGRGVLHRAVGGGLVGMFLFGVERFRIPHIAMDHWWQWLLLFVGQEFCYYWMHRADHRVHWFWLNHSVHHSSRQYALCSAYRLGWTAKLTGSAVFFAPLVLLGFPPALVLGALAANLAYQFWLHTELIGTLPRPVEWLLNTPAHHRVHHASNREYLDSNYGGVLIVFDRMFGTFRAESPATPIRYGLVEPLSTHNPARIAAHAWVRMWRGMSHARGWRQRLRVIFGPPGFEAGKPMDSVFQPAAGTGVPADGGAGNTSWK